MFCPNCGKEIDDKAVICIHCQNDLKPKKQDDVGKNIAMGCCMSIILLILVATIPSFIMDDSYSSTNQQTKAKLEVLDSYNCKTSVYGRRAICGTVINNSDRTYDYVQIEINLYDKNGTQIGSIMDNINNLAPHSKWDFRAMVIEDRADNYKIINVSGF